MFFCIQEIWLMERGVSAMLSEPRLAPSVEQKAGGMGGCNCAHFVYHASRVSFIYFLHSETSIQRNILERVDYEQQGSEYFLSSPPYGLLQISNLRSSSSASPDRCSSRSTLDLSTSCMLCGPQEWSEYQLFYHRCWTGRSSSDSEVTALRRRIAAALQHSPMTSSVSPLVI